MKDSGPINQSNTKDQWLNEPWYRKDGRVTGFCILGYIALSISLAILTPADILSHKWARSLIEITATVTPIFMDVPARSPIPDVVRFYFGVMWLLLPALIVVMTYDGSVQNSVSFL